MVGVIELWLKLPDNWSLDKYDDDGDFSTPAANSTFFTPMPLLFLLRSSRNDSITSSDIILLALTEKLLLLSFSLLLDNDDVRVIGEAPRFTVSAPMGICISFTNFGFLLTSG